MSDLLSIGASGLRSYQTALSTTSDNIANAATPGFSRRATTITEIGGASAAFARSTKLPGSGSFASGVVRAGDAFRAADVRRTQADLSRTTSGIAWLERVETALAGNQLSERLADFFNAAKGVAADPAATAPRTILLENATSLANGFVNTGRAIDAAAADLTEAGRDSATRLTDVSAALLQVNRGLVRAADNSGGQAQLLDQRDRLLEQMSELTDIDVRIDGFGRATVRGGPSGPVLTSVEDSAIISFASNASGAMVFSASRAGSVSALTPTGGAIAGITDAATRVAAARELVTTTASAFAETVNTIQTNGRDLDGNPGAALFAAGTPATEMVVVLTDPRKLAAAAPGEGTRGNGNLADLQAARLSRGFEAGLDDFSTGNGAALLARRSVADAQGSIHDTAVAARDAISGVDIDEEAVDLIRFQQAYQASTRVIQVARETLQAIFDIR